MAHLRKYLIKWQKELDVHVDKGTMPLFGYPPICYSPPEEFAAFYDKAEQKKEVIETLMKHVFCKNEDLSSIPDIIDAKEKEKKFQNEL